MYGFYSFILIIRHRSILHIVYYNTRRINYTTLDVYKYFFARATGLEPATSSVHLSNIFIVEDTLKDPRFADNPTVIGEPFIRFYAGIALFDHRTRQPIGVFCVKDTKPKKLTVQEIGVLIDLANKAEKELN